MESINKTYADKFKELMAYLSIEYDKIINEEQIKLWWSQLKNYDYAAVRNAALQHIQTSRFYPKLADLLDIINNKKDMQLQALQEFKEIIDNLDLFKIVHEHQITSQNLSNKIIANVNLISKLQKQFEESTQKAKEFRQEWIASTQHKHTEKTRELYDLWTANDTVAYSFEQSIELAKKHQKELELIKANQDLIERLEYSYNLLMLLYDFHKKLKPDEDQLLKIHDRFIKLYDKHNPGKLIVKQISYIN